MPTTLVEIFRDSETHHRLSLFDLPALKIIEAMLFEKNGKPHIKCLATDKDRPAKPEEIVRQLWIHKLINYYGYLRLPVICELMDLHTTASMYPAISTTDLMRLPFLLPDDATIKKVKQQITAARAARREAHALLEKAKQAVEVAIEKNEAAGLAMLAK